MKKWGAALLVLGIFFLQGRALAEVVTLYPAAGNAVGLSFDARNVLYYHVSSEHRPQFSDDRGPLFRWMEMGAEAQSTYMVCMPEGRVLGNIYRTEMGLPITAQQLLDIWPLLGENLQKTAAYVDTNSACATVQVRDGVDWLHIQSLVVLDGDQMMALDLEGIINCDDGVMKEIWVASPTDATYRYDEKAAAELAADKEIAKVWLDTVQLIPSTGDSNHP